MTLLQAGEQWAMVPTCLPLSLLCAVAKTLENLSRNFIWPVAWTICRDISTGAVGAAAYHYI